MPFTSPEHSPASDAASDGAAAATGAPARRVLLIRPSALGDVCRTAPCLALLRAAWPGAQIDWLVQDSFADAVRAHPALTAVVPFPRAAFRAALRSLRPGAPLAFLRGLRERGYDVALDLQGLARSGVFARATGAPVRVGPADAREGGWLGYTLRADPGRSLHTVDRMLAVTRAAIDAVGGAAAAGATDSRDQPDMRLHAPPEARAWAASALPREPFVLLAPTSRWPGKQWPAERFAALAGVLRGRGVAVAFVGAAKEAGQVGPLRELAARDAGVIDLLGATSVGQLMAVVERCALLVANDSAALHMGVGFARPLVALFGPTDVARVGPYRRAGDVLRHATPADAGVSHKDHARGRAMMERVTLDEVVRACAERMAV